MHIYSYEQERIRELQRELQAAEQFRALVREARVEQRRCRRQGQHADTSWRNKLEALIDLELGIQRCLQACKEMLLNKRP